MSGWLRHFALNAIARTGFSSQIVIWAIVAAIAAAAAVLFLLIAAFVWLANRYDGVIAGLLLGGAFIVVAMVALAACLMVRRRNMERARLELAARRSASAANWLDPKFMAVGVQIGQAIGWRKLVSLGAVALLAAVLAQEWVGRKEAPAEGGESPPED
jgi:type VI protein secretion system component VasK